MRNQRQITGMPGQLSRLWLFPVQGSCGSDQLSLLPLLQDHLPLLSWVRWVAMFVKTVLTQHELLESKERTLAVKTVLWWWAISVWSDKESVEVAQFNMKRLLFCAGFLQLWWSSLNVLAGCYFWVTSFGFHWITWNNLCSKVDYVVKWYSNGKASHQMSSVHPLRHYIFLNWTFCSCKLMCCSEKC